MRPPFGHSPADIADLRSIPTVTARGNIISPFTTAGVYAQYLDEINATGVENQQLALQQYGMETVIAKNNPGLAGTAVALNVLQPASELAAASALESAASDALAADSASQAPGPTADLTRVGRWMSEEEYDLMKNAQRVQEGAGGKTYVVYPPNPASYTGTASGSVFVEFDVPTPVLRPAGNPLWRQIIGPNIETRLFGPPPAEMPPATNICLVCRK